LRLISSTRGRHFSVIRLATGLSEPESPETEISDFRNGRISVIYGGNAVGDGVGVSLGLAVEVGVFVTLGVREGVTEAVIVGVKEDVIVNEGVNEAGTKGVNVIVLVGVRVGVGVNVGVMVTVPVTIDGVGLIVGETGVFVLVMVAVTEGVRSVTLGARAMAIQPMQ
jgi:hypothetical protein